MIPWHIRCDLISLIGWCLPFAHFTQGQKYLPRKDGTLISVNWRNCSTSFSYSSLMCDACIQLRSMISLCYETSISYPTCMKTSLFFLIGVALSHSGTHCLQYSRTHGYVGLFVYFDKILATFHIVLRVHDMKAVKSNDLPHSSMHLENKVKCIISKFCLI